MPLENPALRKLIGRDRPIPPSMRALLPVWERLSEEIAALLTDMTGVTVQHRCVSLFLTDSTAYAARFPSPGRLVPIQVDGTGGYYVRVSTNDLLVLSSHLLHTSTDFERSSLSPEMIDGFLLRRAIEQVLGRLSATFGVTPEIDHESDMMDEWPFAPPGKSSAYLCATFEYDLHENQTFCFDVTLPPDADGLHLQSEEPPLLDDAFLERIAAGKANVSALLDEWAMDSAQIAAFQVGTIIPLPDASMETLKLVAQTGRGKALLATAEHGKSGREQAIRITSLPSS
ncbi:MAG: FliM/FliN family flagellar motor C-terminal domain-containing protein [Parvularcula sp.]